MARKLEVPELRQIWKDARMQSGIPLSAEIPDQLIALIAVIGHLVEEKIWEVNELKESPRILKS